MLPKPRENCPLCDRAWTNINQDNNAYCAHCQRHWAQMEDFHHVGQWLDVDGEPIHVRGDPNMSEETKNALRDLARAVRKEFDDALWDDTKKRG